MVRICTFSNSCINIRYIWMWGGFIPCYSPIIYSWVYKARQTSKNIPGSDKSLWQKVPNTSYRKARVFNAWECLHVCVQVSPHHLGVYCNWWRSNLSFSWASSTASPSRRCLCVCTPPNDALYMLIVETVNPRGVSYPNSTVKSDSR